MSLTNRLPCHDRWQFLRNPETAFHDMATAFNALTCEGIVESNCADDIVSYLKKRSDYLFGTLVRIKAGIAMPAGEDEEIPSPCGDMMIDLEGSGTLSGMGVFAEVIIYEEENEIGPGDNADVFLRVDTENQNLHIDQRLWIPSKHIKEIEFVCVTPEQLN